jgi:hypothetical protein
MLPSSAIREASAADLPALERLLEEEGRTLGSVQFDSVCGERRVMVLDAPDGGLAAAAVLVKDGTDVRLAMLVIAKRYADDAMRAA